MNINKKQVMLGIICILISSLGFACMQLFVRLAGDLPAMQKTFFRNLIASFIALIPLIKNKKSLNFNKSQIFPLILRSSFGTLGIVLNFFAIEQLTLADASIIQKISPFVVIFLSYIFLGEKIKIYQISAVIIAFIGIILVIKPGNNGLFLSLGNLSALGGAFCAGSAYACVRYLTTHNVNKELIIIFFALFSCITLFPFVIYYYKPMSSFQIFCLLMVGLCATIGQFGLTYAYSYAQASKISVFEYSQVLFSALLGFFVLNQSPDLSSIIGYIIVIGVGIYMFKKEA